jgi:hypothetical protein
MKERVCEKCLHAEVSPTHYPCGECIETEEREMWEEGVLSKECMTCAYGQTGCLPIYCNGCHNFSKWVKVSRAFLSKHWGIRKESVYGKSIVQTMQEIEEDIAYPVRDALEAWLGQDHSIKNPVKDGHEQFHSVTTSAVERVPDGIYEQPTENTEVQLKKEFIEQNIDGMETVADDIIDRALECVNEDERMAYLAGINTGMIKLEGDEIKFETSPVKDMFISEGQRVAGIKDSGKRSEFSTGAVRDVQENKGRLDLLPFLAMLRLSKHYERGCLKYGDRNWEKGIPLSRYFDSGVRHAVKAFMGFKDEHHWTAALWNFSCLIETKDRIELGLLPKELDDLPNTLSKVDYELFEKVLDQLL